MEDGLLALHEARFDQRWLEEAIALGERILDLFWDETQSVFYDTGKDQEALVVRPRDLFDSATPCGSSMAADVLLRLSIISGNPEFSRVGARFAANSGQQSSIAATNISPATPPTASR